MLTKQTSPTLDTTLTVIGQGGTVKFGVVYHNRTQEQVEEHLRAGAVLAKHVVFLVKSWESEYSLDEPGIREMENTRPGMCLALIQGFHKARMVELEKN